MGRHKHEIENGSTSSISHQLIGFDDEGCVTNYSGSVRTLSPEEVVRASSRIVNILDLAGDERYLKVTGMC